MGNSRLSRSSRYKLGRVLFGSRKSNRSRPKLEVKVHRERCTLGQKMSSWQLALNKFCRPTLTWLTAWEFQQPSSPPTKFWSKPAFKGLWDKSSPWVASARSSFLAGRTPPSPCCTCCWMGLVRSEFLKNFKGDKKELEIKIGKHLHKWWHQVKTQGKVSTSPRAVKSPFVTTVHLARMV